jgi:DNA-binding CsgD family transcriptional regulator
MGSQQHEGKGELMSESDIAKKQRQIETLRAKREELNQQIKMLLGDKKSVRQAEYLALADQAEAMAAEGKTAKEIRQALGRKVSKALELRRHLNAYNDIKKRVVIGKKYYVASTGNVSDEDSIFILKNCDDDKQMFVLENKKYGVINLNHNARLTPWSRKEETRRREEAEAKRARHVETMTSMEEWRRKTALSLNVLLPEHDVD